MILFELDISYVVLGFWLKPSSIIQMHSAFNFPLDKINHSDAKYIYLFYTFLFFCSSNATNEYGSSYLALLKKLKNSVKG